MEIQCFKDILEYLKIHKDIKSLKDLSKITGNNYTYLSELNTGRKPLTELFVQTINRKFDTKFVLINKNLEKLSKSNSSDPAEKYLTEEELLELYKIQLEKANKLLEKALDNESKALDLLLKSTEKNNDK